MCLGLNSHPLFGMSDKWLNFCEPAFLLECDGNLLHLLTQM